MQASFNSRTVRLSALSLAFASLAAAAMFWQPAPVAARAGGVDPASAEFYTQNVLPILQTNCYSCHGAPNHRGGLTMDTQAGMMKGGHDGSGHRPRRPREVSADHPHPPRRPSRRPQADAAQEQALRRRHRHRHRMGQSRRRHAQGSATVGRHCSRSKSRRCSCF